MCDRGVHCIGVLMSLCAVAAAAEGGSAEAGPPAGAPENPQPAARSLVWRLYDLRDLMALLPAEPISEPLPWWRQIRPRANVKVTISEHSEPATQWLRHTRVESVPSSLDRVLSDLATQFGVEDSAPLLPGVYLVLADEKAHGRISEWLERVRGLFEQRYRVRVMAYRVPLGELPQVGAPPAGSSPVYLAERVVAQRAVTQWRQHSEYTLLYRVNSNVAEAAVGYYSQVRTAEEGIELRVIVGAGPPRADRVRVSVTGTVQVLDRARKSDPIDGRSLRIDLPSVHTTSVSSSLEIPWGQPTVVAVATPAQDGPATAIAVQVDRVAMSE